MKTWIEIAGVPLQFEVRTHIADDGSLSVIVRGLRSADVAQIRNELEHHPQVVLCTLYDTHNYVIREVIEDATMVELDHDEDLSWIVIQTQTYMPFPTRHSVRWGSGIHHGSGFGRD